MAKLPRNSAKLTRQNRPPPRAIKGGSPAGASNLKVVGVDVTRTQPFRLRGRKASQIEGRPRSNSLSTTSCGLTSGIRRSRLSAPFSQARLDEFVHLPRDGSDIEQSLDALASGAGKLGAPIGRIQQLAERSRDAVGVARLDRHPAWTADLGQAAPPEVMSAAPLAIASSAVRPNGSGPVVSTIPTSARSHAALTSA